MFKDNKVTAPDVSHVGVLNEMREETITKFQDKKRLENLKVAKRRAKNKMAKKSKQKQRRKK